MDDPPLGEPVDFAGARPPGDEVPAGERVRLEPIDPSRHTDGLWAAAAGDPGLWTYLPYGPFADRDGFAAWLAGLGAAYPDVRFLAIVGQADDAPAGMLAYARIAPAAGRIEIAHVWFGSMLQRTPAATEAIFLAADHAITTLGNRRLEWKCHALNDRSRRAAERFGFAYEGTFRQDGVVKGRNRDTAWFSLLDHEWPRARAAFVAWLDPGNVDPDGAQRRTLEELRAAVSPPAAP